MIHIKTKRILVWLLALIWPLMAPALAEDESGPYTVNTHVSRLTFAAKPSIKSYSYIFGDTQCTLHEYNLFTDYETADETLQSHQMLAVITFPDALSDVLATLDYETHESFARLAIDVLGALGYAAINGDTVTLNGNATVSYAATRDGLTYIGWLTLNDKQAVALATTQDDTGDAFLRSVYTKLEQNLSVDESKVTLMDASATFGGEPVRVDETAYAAAYIYGAGATDAYISVDAPSMELACAVQIPDYLLLTSENTDESVAAILAALIPANARDTQLTYIDSTPAMAFSYELNGTTLQAVTILQDGFALELSATDDARGEAFLASATAG